MSNFYSTTAGSVNIYSDSTTTTDNSINNSSNDTNIQDISKNIIGKLFQHIPSGIVRRVVYVDKDYVTLKDDYGYSRFSNIENFKKFWKPYEASNASNTSNVSNDKVNHPSHYTWLKDLCGIEVIDITRWLPADISNAVKYLLRQGHKHEEGMSNNQKAIEDCKKAIWYINDYINNVLKK